MTGGVLHLFVERVDGLKVYANFHDQASIIGVALDDASNILAVEGIHVTKPQRTCSVGCPDFHLLPNPSTPHYFRNCSTARDADAHDMDQRKSRQR